MLVMGQKGKLIILSVPQFHKISMFYEASILQNITLYTLHPPPQSQRKR